MDSRIQHLHKQGESLFTKRQSLESLWQEIAYNFYPERADFTTVRYLGSEFARDLMTSYPLLARRDLGNSFSAMLRPAGKMWFSMQTNRMDRVDNAGRQWLDMASRVQFAAMYGRPAQFQRATKEADHDYAAFGQACISVTLNRNADDLLYRSWHLRDVAWCENEEGKIDTIHRKWKPDVRSLIARFGKTVSQKVKDRQAKDPYGDVQCRHVVIPASEYEGEQKYRTPYVSIYYEVDSGNVLEEVGSFTTQYIIPRWQTVSGSQYAYSAATVAALPDARLIQAMTRVLLDAGEKAVTPPLIAVTDAIRSDIAVYAGGITHVDAEYDERLGEVLRPITQDHSGIPLGLEMSKDTREMIKEAFYLNKITLPPPEQNMTAFEVGQRIQEYIRQALPLFEPMETDYNAALCEISFDTLFRAGTFGDLRDIPQSLSGADIQFSFQSPLRAAIDADKGTRLQQAGALLASVAQLDPDSAAILDAKVALRDALQGIGAPASWLRGEDEVDAMAQQRAEQAQAQQVIAGLQQGGAAAEALGKANQAWTGGPP